jgi:hypothetical protein
MKLISGRRDWALNTAFIFCVILIYLMYGFAALNANPEKTDQRRIYNFIGCLSGALLLPFILPLGALREGKRPSRFRSRLILLGAMFLPSAIVYCLGIQAWQTRAVNVSILSVWNGAVMPLAYGVFMSLAGKNRNLCSTLALSLGLVVYYTALALAPVFPVLFLSALYFYMSMVVLVAIGVFLFVYLLSAKGGQAAEGEPSAKSNVFRPEPENPGSGGSKVQRRIPAFLFPLLAAFVIFWSNSFTADFFIPTIELFGNFSFPNNYN